MGTYLKSLVSADRRAGGVLLFAMLVAAAAFWSLRPDGGNTVEAHDKLDAEEGPADVGEPESMPEKSTRAIVAGELGTATAALPKSDSQLMLEEYFGSDSKEVMALMTEKGIDLNTLPAPVSQAEFESFLPNWLEFSDEERTERRKKLLAWPEALTNDYLRANFYMATDLSADDLAGLDQLASLYKPDIELAVDQYLDHIEVAMATELAAGRVRTSPFLAWPRGESAHNHALSGTPFFSIVRAGQGWVARVSLWTEEHSEALLARDTVRDTVHTRDADLATSISLLQ